MISNINPFAGDWHLVAWAYAWAIVLPQSDNANMDAAKFLYSNTPCEISKFEPANDSKLLITKDYKFIQEGKGQAPILSYDHEGVQISGVAEFSGNLSEKNGVTYLITSSVPNYGKPKNDYDIGRLRIDDGDTKISDTLKIEGEDLVRVMKVVTDYSYGDCVVLRYRKRT